VLAAALVVAARGAGRGAVGCGGSRSGDGGAGENGEAAALTLPVDLYFPGEGGRLFPEHRELEVTDDAERQIREVLAALLAGPRGEGLERPLPEGVEVAGVYLDHDGVAYVDLAAPGNADPPAGGSAAEMQMVYSVVNSVALNVPEARRVALLWNGIQRQTFSGHLDTSRPLLPSPGLVVRR
jgi:hypothetical protein